MTITHRWRGVWWALLVAVPIVATADSAVPLRLAVHPYLPAPELRARFLPLTAYLTRELERPVGVVIGGSYDEHIDTVGRDAVDLAFLGPASYVRLRERYGPRPLLARFEVAGQPYLYGVIAVRADSPLRTLRDLQGARFAFGDPDSTMSHLVSRQLLLQAGIPRGLPLQHKYLGSHKNVALAVLAGDFAAGAMKRETFDEYAPRGLRQLAVTPGVPDHVFVASPRLPPATVHRAQRALYALGTNADGRRILASLHQDLTALVPASDADYDQLRDILRAVDAADR